MTEPQPEREPDREAVSRAADAADAEWWADPSLPWQRQPTRADIACLTAMGVLAVYGLAMIPLRPLLLTQAPFVLAGLGYGAGLAYVGALAAVGNPWWPLVLVTGTLMSLGIATVYYFAGRLWGRRMVDVWASGKSERTRRRWDRAWDVTHRFAVPAILVSFLPLPLPMNVMLVAVGAAGVRVRTFLPVALVGAGVVKAGWVALGYWIGEPAVDVVETYAWVLWIVSIVLLAAMVISYFWRQRRTG
ncbi:MAG: DedA family protein [Propionibacteriaceae bacterium]|nr:DedA family protein [Propionibacteriaceae bacterium]